MSIWDFSEYHTTDIERALILIDELENLGFGTYNEDAISAMKSELESREISFEKAKEYFKDEGTCPICGKYISITGTTKDNRLIGSCKDAITVKQWECEE